MAEQPPSLTAKLLPCFTTNSGIPPQMEMVVSEQTVQRLLHPVDDARHALGGISRATFYEMVKDGRLRLTKIGKRSFVSDPELKRVAGIAPDAPVVA